MLAQITKVEELELSEDEAKKLGNAAQAVMAYYTDTQIPEEVVLWSNLVMAMGSVYGPRYLAYRIRKARSVTPKSPLPITATPVSVPNVTPINRAAETQPQKSVGGNVSPVGIDLQQWSAWNAHSAAIGQAE